MTQWLIIAIKLYVCVRKVLGLNIGRDIAITTEVFYGFRQNAQENSRKLPRLRHSRFLPNIFKLICHLLSAEYSSS